MIYSTTIFGSAKEKRGGFNKRETWLRSSQSEKACFNVVAKRRKPNPDGKHREGDGGGESFPLVRYFYTLDRLIATMQTYRAHAIPPFVFSVANPNTEGLELGYCCKHGNINIL
ncbi:unnamed protein product [Ectocarpus sp. 13 AM-2016]